MNATEARTLFGTDGIRGIANTWPMDSRAALLVGQAVAAYLKRDRKRHRVVVGKDTRLSGYMLETAVVSGLVSMGVDVYLVGPLPTPGIAFITAGMRADAGIVISASHNSYEYNGIKVFDRHGYKFSDELELELEQMILNPEALQAYLAPPDGVGKAFRVDDAVGRYVVSLKSSVPRDMTLDGLRIVVDCANGATYKVAPEVFRELGADVHPVGVTPNGMNINLGVGSTAPEAAVQRVREIGADIGIVLDGDGDRCIFIDEHGQIVDGDAVMAFVGRHYLQRGQLANNTVVATVMSNKGLDASLAEVGGRVVRTPVGDRYVAQTMRELGCNVGGEASGHLIFMDVSTTGDGTLAALQVLRVMRESGKPISELAAQMERYPQVTRNIPVGERRPLDAMPALRDRIAAIEAELAPHGRVLFRYSGTENLVRILVEGGDDARLAAYADELAAYVVRELGEATAS